MQFLRTASTVNTELAAFLATVGIPPDPEKPLEVIVGDCEQVAFFFGDRSPCGLYQCDEMIKAWNDSAFSRARPRHPLAYVRTAFRNRRQLIAYQGGSPSGIVGRGHGARLEVVPILPDHRKPPPALAPPSAAAAATNGSLATTDLELASCLLACGIPLWTPLPVERSAGYLVFHFSPADPTGSFHTAPLMLAWSAPDWHLSHPEHPFAYLWCAFENRRRLVAAVKTHSPTVCILHHGLPAFLPLSSPPALEKKFLSELNRT